MFIGQKILKGKKCEFTMEEEVKKMMAIQAKLK